MNNDEVGKKLAVKVSTERSTGSGLLFSPENQNDLIYIFTCKHCVISEDSSQLDKDVKVEYKLKNTEEEVFITLPFEKNYHSS